MVIVWLYEHNIGKDNSDIYCINDNMFTNVYL